MAVSINGNGSRDRETELKASDAEMEVFWEKSKYFFYSIVFDGQPFASCWLLDVDVFVGLSLQSCKQRSSCKLPVIALQ